MSEDETETAGVGHNSTGLDQDTFEKHTSRLLRLRNGELALAQAAVKAAKKKEREIKADAKKDGMKMGPWEAYLTLRELEDEDAAHETASAYTQYFKWGELGLGEQADLFAGFSPTPSEAGERWRRRGYTDIREGKNDPDGLGKGISGPIMHGKPPSYVPTEFHQAWMDGAYEANAKNEQDFLDKCGPPPKDEDDEQDEIPWQASENDHIMGSVLDDLAKEAV